MKDFPVFTTEFGVASLVLKEIPYQGMAYIIIRDSLEPEKLLEECVGFCRACGAERIYATGHDFLEKYPLYTVQALMCCDRARIPDTDAALFPVQEKTLAQWMEIYNRKITAVPNGAWMTSRDGQEMLKRGDGYFVHRQGTLLGTGIASGDRIDWVASVVPGGGWDVVCALSHAITADTASLTVSMDNEKALRLYERVGFVVTKKISSWHSVFGG